MYNEVYWHVSHVFNGWCIGKLVGVKKGERRSGNMEWCSVMCWWKRKALEQLPLFKLSTEQIGICVGKNVWTGTAMLCVMKTREDCNHRMTIPPRVSIHSRHTMKIGEIGRTGREQRDLRPHFSEQWHAPCLNCQNMHQIAQSGEQESLTQSFPLRTRVVVCLMTRDLSRFHPVAEPIN